MGWQARLGRQCPKLSVTNALAFQRGVAADRDSPIDYRLTMIDRRGNLGYNVALSARLHGRSVRIAMSIYPPTSAIVLAGGVSRRLGQDKRRLRLWGAAGPMLLEHTVGIVARLCADVVVVLNDPDAWADLPAQLVPDVYPDGGSLGGIYSGLQAAKHDYALAVACDMPFLEAALLDTMLARPRDYDVLVPRSLQPGAARNALDVEPLHAIYARSCLQPIQATLEGGRRQIAAFFPLVRVAYVEPEQTRRYDLAGRSFLNVNTPEQMAEAERELRNED
jgi:molybdopterin-guanine dinucleotide biosynthesis protein A